MITNLKDFLKKATFVKRVIFTVFLGTFVISLFAFATTIGTDINTDALDAGDGSATAPSYSYSADTDTGEYRAAANTIGFAGNGAQLGTWTTNLFRINNSTNLNGITIVPAADTLNTFINAINTNAASALYFQTQTFTPGGTHVATTIQPTWTGENFIHIANFIAPTQNGANSQYMDALSITTTKGTAATTLAGMYGIHVNAPAITGTVTNSNALRIEDQTNANATTPRGILFTTAGVANSVVWGGSAIQYATGAENVSFFDSTNARGLALNLTAAGGQTITATGGNLTLTSTSANVNIGTNTNSQIVTIGNATGTTGVVINAGTGNIDIGTTAQARTLNFGTGAAVQLLTIGSTSGASGTTINAGDAGLALVASTGSTVSIGTNATQHTVAVGSTTTTSTTNIQSGTGGINLTSPAIKASGRILKTQGADVASGTSLTLGTDGNSFEITGTTQIDQILTTGWQEGAEVTLIFNESVTVRHGIATSGSNVTILLAGAANFSATANDTLTLILGSTTAGGQAWREKSRSAI